MSLIKEWCEPFNHIADIGAGQGRLARALLGRPERVVYATEHHLPGYQELRACTPQSGSLHCLLGDGLEAVHIQLVDMTVIAGMGPHTIEKILSQHYLVPQSQFIVQPMHGLFTFHHFLSAGPWDIQRAALTKEHGRIYGTWQLRVSDSKRGHPTTSHAWPEEFRGDPLYTAVLTLRVEELAIRLKGTAHTLSDVRRQSWLAETAALLDEMETISNRRG